MMGYDSRTPWKVRSLTITPDLDRAIDSNRVRTIGINDHVFSVLGTETPGRTRLRNNGAVTVILVYSTETLC